MTTLYKFEVLVDTSIGLDSAVDLIENLKNRNPEIIRTSFHGAKTDNVTN